MWFNERMTSTARRHRAVGGGGQLCCTVLHAQGRQVYGVTPPEPATMIPCFGGSHANGVIQNSPGSDRKAVATLGFDAIVRELPCTHSGGSFLGYSV